MSDRIAFLHIGYPKTATTFLQRKIFPKIDSVRYVGRHLGIEDDIPFLNVLNQAVSFQSQKSFEARIPLIHELLKEEENRLFNDINPSVPLLMSDEDLLFRTLIPFEIPWFDVKYSACVKRLFTRIKILFEKLSIDVRIILTLRNQVEIIHSLYAEKYYYYTRFNELNTFEKYLKEAFYDVSYFDNGLCNLEYDETINILGSLFNTDNFIFLKYEDLDENPDRFFDELLDFINPNRPPESDIFHTSGERDNMRILTTDKKKANYKANADNDVLLKLLSKSKRKIFGNKTPFKSLIQKLVRLRSKGHHEIEMSSDQKEFIKNWYKKSNERLAAYDKNFGSYIE